MVKNKLYVGVVLPLTKAGSIVFVVAAKGSPFIKTSAVLTVAGKLILAVIDTCLPMRV